MGRVAISYNPEKHLGCATPSKSLAQNNFLCTKYSKHFLNRNVEPTDQEEPRNCTRGLQPQPLFLYSRKETISWSILSLPDDFVASMVQDHNFDLSGLGD